MSVLRKQTVHLKFDEDTYRLMHHCDNAECESKGVLPIYMVDYEIYRYLPSAIISKVDKLMILGNNPSFRNILVFRIDVPSMIYQHNQVFG